MRLLGNTLTVGADPRHRLLLLLHQVAETIADISDHVLRHVNIKFGIKHCKVNNVGV